MPDTITALHERNRAHNAIIMGRAGDNLGSPGGTWLPYSNAYLAATTSEHAEPLARAQGLTGLDVALLGFAGEHHADEALSAPGQNEAISARRAVTWLKRHTDVDPALIQAAVHDPILGTRWDEERRCYAANPAFVHQAVLADAAAAPWGAEDGTAAWLRYVVQRLLGPVGNRRRAILGLGHYRTFTALLQYRYDPDDRDAALQLLREGVDRLTNSEYLLDDARESWGDQRKRNGEKLAALTDMYEDGAPFYHLLRAA